MTLQGITIEFWDRHLVSRSYLLSNVATARLQRELSECYAELDEFTAEECYLWMTNDRVLHEHMANCLRASIETECREFFEAKSARERRGLTLRDIQAWFIRMRKPLHERRPHSMRLRDATKIVNILWNCVPAAWCHYPAKMNLHDVLNGAVWEFFLYQLLQCQEILERHFVFDEVMCSERSATVTIKPAVAQGSGFHYPLLLPTPLIEL